MSLPNSIKLIEVGPRDGLQDEKKILSVDTRVEFINQLSECGYKNIEVGSFVSDRKVPQMHNTSDIFSKITRHDDINYSALIPNMRGLEDALVAKVDSIAVFMAASESFSSNNINCSIEESLIIYNEVIGESLKHNIPIRGYLSCAFHCPYEGFMNEDIVVEYAKKLFDLGCQEIALGDTTGLATPASMSSLIKKLSNVIPISNLTFHLHNTNGLSLVNIYTAIQLGVTSFDCSIAGLGGCPFAKNSTGNVASEDLVYMLNSLNIKTSLDLKQLIKTSLNICKLLEHKSNSNITNISDIVTFS